MSEAQIAECVAEEGDAAPITLSALSSPSEPPSQASLPTLRERSRALRDALAEAELKEVSQKLQESLALKVAAAEGRAAEAERALHMAEGLRSVEAAKARALEALVTKLQEELIGGEHRYHRERGVVAPLLPEPRSPASARRSSPESPEPVLLPPPPPPSPLGLLLVHLEAAANLSSDLEKSPSDVYVQLELVSSTGSRKELVRSHLASGSAPCWDQPFTLPIDPASVVDGRSVVLHAVVCAADLMGGGSPMGAARFELELEALAPFAPLALSESIGSLDESCGSSGGGGGGTRGGGGRDGSARSSGGEGGGEGEAGAAAGAFDERPRCSGSLALSLEWRPLPQHEEALDPLGFARFSSNSRLGVSAVSVLSLSLTLTLTLSASRAWPQTRGWALAR